MRNRKLGFVFQDIRFLDGLTVQENILLLAIIGGTVSAMTEARADQLCDDLRWQKTAHCCGPASHPPC